VTSFAHFFQGVKLKHRSYPTRIYDTLLAAFKWFRSYTALSNKCQIGQRKFSVDEVKDTITTDNSVLI
jgi:hypothetical protein